MGKLESRQHIRLTWRMEIKDDCPSCDECGVNPPDYPSKICVGCEAYKDHQR